MSGSVTVLHVDDEPDFVDMAATYLERMDGEFEVIAETSAEAGLEVLTGESIDCVVADYDMPGMDGLEFLEAVRDDHPELPFILFTGMGSEEVASDAISAGVTDYLQKETGTGQYELLANRIRNAVAQHEAERRASAVDRRFRELTEATDDIFWMFDAEWSELLFVNSAYEEIWGRSIEALEEDARDFLEGIHPEDRERVQEAMGALSTGEAVELEYRVNEAEDYDRWVWVKGVALRGKDGSVDRVGGFARDITDRKARERELELHRRAMDEAPIGVTMTDPNQADNPLVYANERFQDLTGYPEEAALGRNCRFLQGEDTDPEPVRELREAVDEERPTSVELLNYQADGTPFWNQVTIAPVTDEDGDVRNFVGFQRDVTERTEQQQQLREQKTKIEALHGAAARINTCETRTAVYEELVEAARDVLEYDIVIADEAQGQVLVPQAASSMLDSEQYFEETPIFADDNLAAKAYRTEEPSVVEDLWELEVTPADSEFRSALTVPIGDMGVFQTVSKEPLAYDESDLELVELLVAPARETLARLNEEEKLRRRTAELERKNDRLDEFASLVSHDLRNPLNLAQGHLELAQEEVENEHLETVATAHDRMEDLISDLLELTRHGDDVEDVEPVSVPGIVEGCWATIETADADLHVEGEDWSVVGDQGRLQQLFENLFRNAVEHGGETVTVGPCEDGFYVADDGPGIPEEDHEAVFEYGYSTREDGSGLGLAIVAQIAEAHGWSVSVTASDADGAQFEFRGVDRSG